MGLIRFLIRVFVSKPRSRYTYFPSSQPAAPHPYPPAIRFSGRVSLTAPPQPQAALVGRCYVIDGDTIDIGGVRIRLAGIDAPEMDHPFGKNAKWTLIHLCKGQEIRAVFAEGMTHDRTVATCYLPDGRDLSAEMVRAGMAIDWPKFSGGKYRHLEVEGIRRKLWRCDARQKGRMPPAAPLS